MKESKIKNLDVTTYSAITNPNESISLHNLLGDNGKLSGYVGLEFKTEDGSVFWDNPSSILSFLRAIENKYKKEYKKDLEKVCEECKLDYKQTKRQLKDIYIMSKHLKWWNSKK